ncbi:MAG: hypothetical protein C4582_12830 [Desulfobacteraceae bacterium]|jgi:hypothetical protein|nr:MAG: hypothetical protein C4582_12830 [Desulfobacteraceae bacterium]
MVFTNPCRDELKMEISIMGTIRGALCVLIAFGLVPMFIVGGDVAFCFCMSFHNICGSYRLSCISVFLRPYISSKTCALVMTPAPALFASKIMSLLFGGSGTSVPSFHEADKFFKQKNL